jgi:hypothetical protein
MAICRDGPFKSRSTLDRLVKGNGESKRKEKCCEFFWSFSIVVSCYQEAFGVDF